MKKVSSFLASATLVAGGLLVGGATTANAAPAEAASASLASKTCQYKIKQDGPAYIYDQNLNLVKYGKVSKGWYLNANSFNESSFRGGRLYTSSKQYTGRIVYVGINNLDYINCW